MILSFEHNSRSFRLYRYKRYDAGPSGYTEDDYVIRGLWARTCIEKKQDLYCVAVDADKYDASDFLKEAKRKAPHFWIWQRVSPNPDIIGWFEFQSVMPHRAEMHFMLFDSVGSDSLRTGRRVVDELMAFYGFRVVYGLTPPGNKLALKLLSRIGWTVLGLMPHGTYVARHDSDMPATVVYYTRGIL